MSSDQQQQALEYFRKFADDWRSKALGRESEVNVIALRNGFALSVAQNRPATRTLLDIGCGTGELVCDAAAAGIKATGVDYAPEMIELASKKAADDALADAKFVCQSVFDFDMAPGSYDMVAANGFIEYISQPDMEKFFDLVAQSLTDGGSFVVGSRNRLFNLMTTNAFTRQEIDSGDYPALIDEACQLAEIDSIDALDTSRCAKLQAANTTHAATGIDVTTRYQYTPAQLINILSERGLKTVELYPVHIHGISPALKQLHPQMHTSISLLLQSAAQNQLKLITQASTFMLHARKES